jgi:hypothetical protein
VLTRARSQHQNVTWDTSDEPALISNKFSVVLAGSAHSFFAAAVYHS